MAEEPKPSYDEMLASCKAAYDAYVAALPPEIPPKSYRDWMTETIERMLKSIENEATELGILNGFIYDPTPRDLSIVSVPVPEKHTIIFQTTVKSARKE